MAGVKIFDYSTFFPVFSNKLNCPQPFGSEIKFLSMFAGKSDKCKKDVRHPTGAPNHTVESHYLDAEWLAIFHFQPRYPPKQRVTTSFAPAIFMVADPEIRVFFQKFFVVFPS